MQFTTNVLLLLGAASGLMAFPSDQPNTTYVELYREKVSNGSLVYLGPSPGSNIVSKDVHGLEKRADCGKAQTLTCGSSHQARNNLCDQLVTELFADGSIGVDSSPQQICFEADDSKNFCCVSWSAKSVPGLTKVDLAAPANNILQKCTSNGISGKIDNHVFRGRACTDVCLSNRGTFCT